MVIYKRGEGETKMWECPGVKGVLRRDHGQQREAADREPSKAWILHVPRDLQPTFPSAREQMHWAQWQAGKALVLLQILGKYWNSKAHVRPAPCPGLWWISTGSISGVHITYECWFHPPQEVFILSTLATNPFGVWSVSWSVSSWCLQSLIVSLSKKKHVMSRSEW